MLDDVTTAAPGSTALPSRRTRAWRLLGVFWALILFCLAGGATALQIMGAPTAPAHTVTATAEPPRALVEPHSPKAPSAVLPKLSPKAVAQVEAPTASSVVLAPLVAPSPPSQEPILTPAAPAASHAVSVAVPQPRLAGEVAPPDPTLLEYSTLYTGTRLPRIGADRRLAMNAYAAPFNAADPRPRVAILLAGIGMNEAESTVAVTNLPPAISFAVSPYANRPERLLENARKRGHELLLSLPMEPQGYPLNDPGTQALLTGATQAANAQRLEWAMTRFAGYVGATGALGDMRGERFAAATDQMAPLLDTLADRGLLYIDPRQQIMRGAGVPTQRGVIRAVDLVLDEPAGPAELDRRLARLEQLARDRGAALGLAGRPTPVTIDRIATWALNLGNRGVALAPVSVVVQMPQAPAPTVRVNLLR